MEDWRFYHFAPQIKLDWIMKELTCEHFYDLYTYYLYPIIIIIMFLAVPFIYILYLCPESCCLKLRSQGLENCLLPGYLQLSVSLHASCLLSHLPWQNTHHPAICLCDLLLLIRKLSLIEIKGKLLVQIFFHNSFLILLKQKYWYIQRIANYLNLWERKNDP